MQKVGQILITAIVLAGLFLVSNLIMAWTSPTADPPAGNVDTPINVSSTAQYKEGPLGIGGALRAYSAVQLDSFVSCGRLTTDVNGLLQCN